MPKADLIVVTEWQRMADLWLATKDAVRTRTEYRKVLRDLEHLFGDLKAITPRKLTRYRETLMRGVDEGALSATTVAHRLTVLKGFLKFAREAGAHDITDTALDLLLPRPKAHNDTPIEEPTEEEYRAILDACTCERDRLLILMANETGARCSELIELTMRDFVRRDGVPMVNITGKGRKRRSVPLSDIALASLDAFCKENDLKIGTSAPLFRSRNGEALSDARVRQILIAARQRAGVRDSVTLHKFRHKAGIEILRGSKDVNATRDILGHADLKTTTRYVNHLSARDVASAMSARRSAAK